MIDLGRRYLQQLDIIVGRIFAGSETLRYPDIRFVNGETREPIIYWNHLVGPDGDFEIRLFDLEDVVQSTQLFGLFVKPGVNSGLDAESAEIAIEKYFDITDSAVNRHEIELDIGPIK
ncbi:MAG: hypothetical protein L6Q71_12430 [Planctomycetes bacterium]|nr:hypothetical protein [Planctomycetota bacterium]